jgi:hypothetical protein
MGPDRRPGPVGHKNLGSARDQVFVRVRSTCSASGLGPGIRTVQWARHLFREHCQATTNPMAHPRMAAGESHPGVGRRGVGLSTIARLVEVSPLSPGVGTSPELFRGFGAGRTAPKETCWSCRGSE